MLHRPFTLAELCRFTIAATRVRDEVDRELGELLLRVAAGDDSALPLAHDRMNIVGRFEQADKLREMMR